MAEYTDKHGHIWTDPVRDASYRKTQKAIKNGEILPAKVIGCNRCKQKQGIIEYHNHCYEHPTDFLEPLCFRCHLIFHAEHKCPKESEEYFDGVSYGKQWPPCFKRDLSILWRDHGITFKKNKESLKKSTEPASIPINRYKSGFQNYIWPEPDSNSETQR